MCTLFFENEATFCEIKKPMLVDMQIKNDYLMDIIIK